MKAFIEIVDGPIDVPQWTARLGDPSAGALATFVGVVRDNARGKRVTGIEYEGYREMALGEMKGIAQKAAQRWPVLAIAIVHRLGPLEIGEASVLVAVASAHRADAFEACRFAIDALKQTVPIWKKERYEDGEEWVEG